jgi:hypothetical protein
MSDLDYPAAHSMDTNWFAIDARGHVGVFTTGEPGHMPATWTEQTYVGELVGPVLASRGGAQAVGLDPERVEDEPWEAVPLLGVFVYDYPDDYGPLYLPYGRQPAPTRPIHVDQLPPKVRELCRRVRFENVDFAKAERLQPFEHVACVGWSEPEAYLSSDGVTVRPVPGEEGAFAEFVEEYLRNHPEEARRYVFLPPPGESGTQPR